MSRKGGWYDKDDDYYDHDDDDDYDDDYDDGFGAYDTGSLAPKAKGAKGGGGQASGAKGAKGGTVGDKGGSAQSRPSKPTSAMAKQMGSTPKEKGVVAPSGGAPPGYPARPDPSTRASTGGKPPPPGFDFATPSPDEAVMAKRVKPTGGTVPGFASLSLDDGRSSSTAVAQKPPPSRPIHEYVPSDDELANTSSCWDTWTPVNRRSWAACSTSSASLMPSNSGGTRRTPPRSASRRSRGHSRWTPRRRSGRGASPSTWHRRGS